LVSSTPKPPMLSITRSERGLITAAICTSPDMRALHDRLLEGHRHRPVQVQGVHPGRTHDGGAQRRLLHLVRARGLDRGHLLGQRVGLGADRRVEVALEREDHVRKGVTFHDGKALTVEDVVFSLKRHLDPAVGSKDADELVVEEVAADVVARVRLLGRVERVGGRAGIGDSPDAKTWTFKIRKGVTFHDGKALTVEDVVFSLSTMRTSFGPAASIAVICLASVLALEPTAGSRCNKLVRIDQTGAPGPELAESYDSPDAKTWTFKIRKGSSVSEVELV
jgi:hypothetical protein